MKIDEFVQTNKRQPKQERKLKTRNEQVEAEKGELSKKTKEPNRKRTTMGKRSKGYKKG